MLRGVSIQGCDTSIAVVRGVSKLIIKHRARPMPFSTSGIESHTHAMGCQPSTDSCVSAVCGEPSVDLEPVGGPLF